MNTPTEIFIRSLRNCVDRLELALADQLSLQASNELALREAKARITELERKIQWQCAENAELARQLTLRETTIVDLVLKGR